MALMCSASMSTSSRKTVIIHDADRLSPPVRQCSSISCSVTAAVVFVDAEPVDRAYGRAAAARHGRTAWPPATAPSRRRRSFRWRSPTTRCCDDLETDRRKRGSGKPWPQTCRRQRVAASSSVHVPRWQRAVGLDSRSRSAGVSRSRATASKAVAKALEVALRAGSGRRRRRGRRSAGSVRGCAFGHQIQRVAQMQRRVIERPEPLISPSLPRAKANGRAVKSVLDARGEDADHALMPLRIEQAQRVAVAGVMLLQARQRGCPACPASMSRRSRFSRSSSRGDVRARVPGRR